LSTNSYLIENFSAPMIATATCHHNIIIKHLWSYWVTLSIITSYYFLI